MAPSGGRVSELQYGSGNGGHSGSRGSAPGSIGE